MELFNIKAYGYPSFETEPFFRLVEVNRKPALQQLTQIYSQCRNKLALPHGLSDFITGQPRILVDNSNVNERPSSMLRFLLLAILCTIGCSPLRPKSISAHRVYGSPQLRDCQPQIQRGESRKVIDCIGWVVGIPSKIILWNRRVENHHICPDTEVAMAEYLAVNGLDTVRVRMNQYYPRDDWRRLVRNKSVGAGWRYTFGAVSVLGETIFPGRIFGGDHFNPYTNTIHLYSDIPAVALHEGGHAKDFARRKWKGSYAAVYALPIVPLYHESIASRDVMAYLETLGTAEDQAAANRILFPAYGTYVGSAAGSIVPAASTPLYVAGVVGGHICGRVSANRIASNSQSINAQSHLQYVPLPQLATTN